MRTRSVTTASSQPDYTGTGSYQRLQSQIIVQCPCCQTKFGLNGDLLDGHTNPRFHCSRCDHVFDAIASEIHPVEPKYPVEQRPYSQRVVESPAEHSAAAPERHFGRAQPEEKLSEQNVLDSRAHSESSLASRTEGAFAPAVETAEAVDRGSMDMPVGTHESSHPASAYRKPGSVEDSEPNKESPRSSIGLKDLSRALEIPAAIAPDFRSSAPHETAEYAHDTQLELALFKKGSVSTPAVSRGGIAEAQTESRVLPELPDFEAATTKLASARSGWCIPAIGSALMSSGKSLLDRVSRATTRPARDQSQEPLREPSQDVAESKYAFSETLSEAELSMEVPATGARLADHPALAFERSTIAPSSALLPDLDEALLGDHFSRHGDTVERQTPRGNSERWTGVVVLMTPLLGFLALLGLTTAYFTMSPQTAVSMSEAILPDSHIPPPAGLHLSRTRFSVVELESGQKLPLVNGKVVNSTGSSFDDIILEAAAYDETGKTISRTRVKASTELLKGRTKSLSPDLIRKLQEENQASIKPLNPGEQRDFSVVFTDGDLRKARYFAARIHAVRR